MQSLQGKNKHTRERFLFEYIRRLFAASFQKQEQNRDSCTTYKWDKQSIFHTVFSYHSLQVSVSESDTGTFREYNVKNWVPANNKLYSPPRSYTHSFLQGPRPVHRDGVRWGQPVEAVAEPDHTVRVMNDRDGDGIHHERGLRELVRTNDFLPSLPQCLHPFTEYTNESYSACAVSSDPRFPWQNLDRASAAADVSASQLMRQFA